MFRIASSQVQLDFYWSLLAKWIYPVTKCRQDVSLSGRGIQPFQKYVAMINLDITDYTPEELNEMRRQDEIAEEQLDNYIDSWF